MIARVLPAVLGILLSYSVAAGKGRQDAPLPTGHVRLEFREHLRISQDLQLTATTETRSISFRLPSRFKPLPGSSLHLLVRHSEDLDKDRSFLSISLNHGDLRSFRLDQGTSTHTEVVVPIPPAMLKPQNELAFSVEQLPRPNTRGEIWSTISARSFLTIRYKEELPPLNLEKLPAPLLEPHSLRDYKLAVLLPARFEPSTLEATALLTANLCKRLAPDRVTVHVVRSMHATREPLLLVGTLREQPELTSLRGRAPLDFSRFGDRTVLRPTDGGGLGEHEGVVGLATRAQSDANPILFVTGNSAAAVLRAARSVLSPDWSVSGNFVRVAKDTKSAPSKVREWPGFIPPRSFFHLAELGFHDLKVTPEQHDSLVIPLNATPDARFLDYGNRMVLKFRLNPDVYVGNARLLVQVNDVTLADEVVRERFRRSIASVPVMIPTHLLKPRNALRIVWKGPSDTGPQGAVAWLLSTSEFYLPRYFETELPELGLLRSQLYPFGLKGDLSDVLIVLPNDLTQETFSALLELSVGFARLAPAHHLAFRVRRVGDLTHADLSESHLVFLNLESRRDATTALLPDWKRMPRMEAFKGRPTIREMASPWNPRKYVLIISAPSGAQLHRAVSGALSDSNLAQLRGDIAFLADSRPESFTIGPRRKVADYSYQVFVEAWLRAHWLALPIILISVSGLLFVGVRLALHRYGRSRALIQLDRPG